MTGGGQRPTINHYMKCRKRRVSARQLEKRQLSIVKTPVHEKGDFAPLPIEVMFRIIKFIPLVSLGSLTLTSKQMRDIIIMYVHSQEGARRVIPVVQNIPEHSDLDSDEYKSESKRCHSHYKQLGVMLKRTTCLFSTRDRLAEVGKILDQLRDSHVRICTKLGSDLAYSCYGIFLHAFIAGWEDDEKSKSFQAIKGASLLEERIGYLMKSKPGTMPGYERYIRVFCREIFLNKASKTEKGFWMAQILKPYPIFFQARLLFILYGPTDLENDDLIWDEMAVSSDIATEDLKELAEGMVALQDDQRGLWSADDIISIFDEITTISMDWDIENIAVFMKECGDTMCCEVLGNKAINGRVSELSYILYYLWQRCCHTAAINSKKEQEWFIALMQHLGKLLPRTKDQHDLTRQIFNVWEENMMDSIEDQTMNTDSQQSLQEEEREKFRESLQSITTLTSILLAREMVNSTNNNASN